MDEQYNSLSNNKELSDAAKDPDSVTIRYLIKHQDDVSKPDNEAIINNLIHGSSELLEGFKVHLDPSVTKTIPSSKKKYILALQLSIPKIGFSKEYYVGILVSDSVISSIY